VRRIEPRHVAAGRADADRERLPPRFEGRLLDLDEQRALFDFVQAGLIEQHGEPAPAGAGKRRFVLDVVVELPRRVPEQTQRPLAAGVIPDTSGNDSARSRHARHLAQPEHRIGHEMNDQLRQHGIEQTIPVRQLLGDTTLDLDPGMATPSLRDEQLRGIDSTDRASPEPLDQLLRRRARAAAHIERPPTGDDAGELGELGANGTEYRPMNRSYSSGPAVKLTGGM